MLSKKTRHLFGNIHLLLSINRELRCPIKSKKKANLCSVEEV
jgi:hypothetical protein